ncbi:putative lipoprotein [Psychromonas sp. CNPT3]|nr:putative lipoprotein [Psychromonas sp. CNPT3]
MIVLFISSCSSSKTEKPKVEDKPPSVLYQDAKAQLQAANYEKASEILEALDSRYPFGPHSDQVQLDLIYSYYKRDESALALANIDRFMRLNPTHPDLDYLYYMRGLTQIAADQEFFQSLFNIERFDRDPSHALQAFKDFSQLVKFYPKSQYAADAQLHLIDIKSRLARYELSIAKWYFKREAYIASINRTKIILNNYPDSDSIEDALVLMIKGYERLNLVTPKTNALAILKMNYPKNRLLK